MEQRQPWLSADWPGIGGQIKGECADFVVEEIPAYEPSGVGPHLYLWIEKRDLGHEFFVRQVAQRLGIRPGDVGTAGMKDRRAITRQWISVPDSVEPRVQELASNDLQVLKVARHTNKLKPGHLRGNHFTILIRGVADDAAARAEPILALIQQQGLPNYYGEQRFGKEGETVQMGWSLLRGEASGRRSPFLRKLALSAVQAQLFNDYLGRRLADGLLRTVLPGDVLAKWPVGGLFISTDPATDQSRLERREVIPAGPMFGKKMFPARDVAAERETALLREHHLALDSFRGFGSLLDGTRRQNFVYVDNLRCGSHSAGLQLSFTLPAGSYATVLLREVMKAA
jgi:tRNA pseudouridine13 synthase